MMMGDGPRDTIISLLGPENAWANFGVPFLQERRTVGQIPKCCLEARALIVG